MSEKTIFYKYPQLYIQWLKWIHRNNFLKRYRYMASFVKNRNLVLEPGCGPAILADFLPKGSLYRGFDTNKDFIDYALTKHLNVYLGNVLDLKNYCQANIVIACDIFHHLKPIDRQRFIKNCFLSAKDKFIICDPGKRERNVDRFFYPLRKRLVEWAERDGMNNVRFDHCLTHEQLLDQIKCGFGIIPKSIKREVKSFGEDIIAVFTKT